MTQTLHDFIGHQRARADSAAGYSGVRQWIDRIRSAFVRFGISNDVGRIKASAVRDACLSLRLGRIDEAETILRLIAGGDPRHAAWLNLMGVICEARGNWRRAKRYYGRAMRADRNFAPAEQNMRRWYELFTFGRTKLPVALGDDRIEH